MTEEQNKLADRIQAMLDQVGHPDYSLRELYEGLKLIVWELRQEREPATEAVLDSARLDFLLKLAGPTVHEAFEFKGNDPQTNANHYVWHKDKQPRSVQLSRTVFGRWRLEQCNGADFEDYEMVEIAEGRNLREMIDAAMQSTRLGAGPSNEGTSDRQHQAALKGKGASQGPHEYVDAATGAIEEHGASQGAVAKWCSYCETDTHNDAECWYTRPVGWSRDKYVKCEGGWMPKAARPDEQKG